MTATPEQVASADGARVDGLLAAVAEQLGRPLPARLEQAFHRVHRHRFRPGRIWLRDGSGGYKLVDRAADPDRWMTAAFSDEPIVTLHRRTAVLVGVDALDGRAHAAPGRAW
ncbi:hypothetical protein [Streptomyces sp. NPDC058613]|uniref:hypothetical protein n=1 Tax=Streptomyces sp. NPDC058613 TaxID=3346556 RepID=UPI00364837CA